MGSHRGGPLSIVCLCVHKYVCKCVFFVNDHECLHISFSDLACVMVCINKTCGRTAVGREANELQLNCRSVACF